MSHLKSHPSKAQGNHVFCLFFIKNVPHSFLPGVMQCHELPFFFLCDICAGIVESGLFISMAEKVYFGSADGSVSIMEKSNLDK